MSDDTVLHVAGASPYDVVVGHHLSARLPELLGDSVERVAVLYAGSLGALADPVVDVLVEHYDVLAGVPVVFLRVGLSEAVKRVGLRVGRPMLLGNVRSRIKALLDERTPVYESVATHVVDTDDRTPDEVAAEVQELFR